MAISERLAALELSGTRPQSSVGLTADLPPAVSPHAIALLQRIDTKLGGLEHRMIQFMAASPDDDTSAIASAYAGAVIERTQRAVLLVDGPNNSMLPGVVETIQAGRPLTEAHAANTKRLSIARLLGDSATPPSLTDDSLWAILRESFDEVVLNAGAVPISRTAMLTAPRADGVVVVVQAERTRYQALRRLMDDLAAVNAPVLGVVLANRTNPIPAILRSWF